MSTRTTKNAGELDSLIEAITEKLAAQDHASRLQRATALAASLFPDHFTPGEIGTPTAKASALQEDLGQDPGEMAVGMLGIYWDDEVSDGADTVRVCDRFVVSGPLPYLDCLGTSWKHFRHVPTTPEVLQWLKDNNV